MQTDPASRRISDDERQRACAALRDAAGDGRLTMPECYDRIDLVLVARTESDLAAALSDLREPAPVTTSPAPAAAVGTSASGPVRSTTAVLMPNRRTGRWRPGRRHRAVTILGRVQVDLREAELDGHDLHLGVFAILGAVKVVVDPGTDVSVDCSGILSSIGRAPAAAFPARRGPMVHVRGGGILARVSVRTDDGLPARTR